MVHLARDLRACPHVARAFTEGVLDGAKVAMLMRARTRVEELFAEHEEAIVAEIRSLTVDQARNVIAHWRRLALATVGVDDDGSEVCPIPATPRTTTRSTCHRPSTVAT